MSDLTISAPHLPHLTPYSTFVKVWGLLLGLTALLVLVSSLHLGSLGLIATLLITPAKVVLVLAFFMHLRNESRQLQAMVAIAFVTFLVFLGLLLLDVLLR